MREDEVCAGTDGVRPELRALERAARRRDPVRALMRETPELTEREATEWVAWAR